MSAIPVRPGGPDAAVPSRIVSIDLLRGLVMVLMAIDHVRVYAGVPAGGPAPGVFFTRWITHFCAPVFVFLAGTSVFLAGRRHAGLSRHLLLRGLWLVLLELTVLRLAWTFNFDLLHLMAGVIWVIGWSFVLMAGLVRLPWPLVGAFGLLVMAGHNLLDPHLAALTPRLAEGPLGGAWKILYLGFFAGPVTFGAGGPWLTVLYSLVPWVGVMAAGYAFGRVFAWPAPRRDRFCLGVGLGAVALFLVLRGFNLYGDPRPWSVPPADAQGGPALAAFLSFLNTTKYPASFLFLLMTLGPALALLPALERARGRVADALALFGRVPFFYYLLHIPLIHALALCVSLVRTGAVDPWLFANHPMNVPRAPAGYAWSLPLLYAVWAAALMPLYLACRWYAGVKARRPGGWLRYL